MKQLFASSVPIPFFSICRAVTVLCMQVEGLVTDGISPGVTDSSKHAGVHFAASKGELEILQFLHTKGVDLDVEDACGRSALHYAAANNHEAVIQYLAEKGCWLDATDEMECTALHLAASWNGPDAALRLIKCGAKPSLPNHWNLRPIGTQPTDYSNTLTEPKS
jgi:ankyrin repeat protein